MAENRDSARKGKAVEHLVAASSILISGLELNVSTSLVDDEGVDLVFHRRERSATLAVQVKSRSKDAKSISDRSRFIANVGVNTFRARADLYMLFVVVDMSDGTLGPMWFVPSVVFKQKTNPNAKNRRQFVASTKSDTQDQWREFKCSRSELPSRILGVLDSLGPR